MKNNNICHNNKIKSNILAFSLIELSIVLIIIGLLVAGITGGQSLIESAKARAVMNEARGYMQAVNTYFVANGRLPGDPDNRGKMGRYSENDITDSDYEQDISDWNAPWFDLNKEGVVDWDRDENNEDYDLPYYGKESKYIKKAIYQFTYASSEYSPNWTDLDAANPDYQKGLENKNVIDLNAKYGAYIPSRIVMNIEEKMDDKSLDTGSIRVGYCSENTPVITEGDIDGGDVYERSVYGDVATYEDLVDAKNGGCDEITFKLDL